jgi:nitrite reductase (NADH) small subunit
MSNYVKIASVAQVPPGSGIVASLENKEYAVFNVDGAFYVIDNTCKHRGGPLGEGELEGETVTCPWHSWQYNVKTGACLTKDGIKMDAYEVRVEDGEIKIAVPEPS